MQIVSKKTSPKKLFLMGCSGLVLFVFAVGFLAYELKRDAYAAPSCTSIYQPVPAWLIGRINSNKSVYQQVASETGVPWELLAAIHFREFNNEATVNPSNGQGIYQLYSVYYSENPQERAEYRELAKPGPVSSGNFLKQTRYAAKFIQGKAQMVSTPKVQARKLTAGETNMELIKNTLFSYNGRASVYANQAASLGFDKKVYPYEGSPYVMNQFDCYRESMGLITYDGGNTLTAKDTRMGAFTLYARLRGDAFWKNLQATSMQAASRVEAHVIKASSDKTGDIAKVGFTLSRKPSHNVTLTYAASSPSNAKVLQSKITIRPSNWNKADQNVIEVIGLNNLALSGTFEYSLVPTRGIISNDDGFRSVVQSQLPQPKLVQQSAQNNNAVYRLYSPELGKHAFTASGLEKQALLNEGWRDEGSRFSYCTAGNLPIIKLHNPTTDEYRLAAIDSQQYQDSISAGFVYDKMDFTTSTISGTPVYWRYDATNNRSLYTTSKTEATTAPWVDMGVAFTACDSSSEAVYRMYRYSNNAHFYTPSTSERNNLVKNGTYRYEGVSFYACRGGDIPIHRMYRPSNDTHFLTTSGSERDSIVRNLGFRYEGVTAHLCTDTERPVYRLFRSSNQAHFLTSSGSERTSLSGSGFRDEGVKMSVE